MKIPLRPVPLFLQFKVPQIVWRGGENMPQGFWVPYFRMHLRTKRPNQHRLLLDWEASGHLVYYATPDFWRTEDLDRHFLCQKVHLNSWYVRPSQIGPLDNKPHYLAYLQKNPNFWRYSEPRKLEADFSPRRLTEDVEKAIEAAKPQEPLKFLWTIAQQIANATRRDLTQMPPYTEERTSKSGPADSDQQGSSDEHKRMRELVQAARNVGYASQVHLGCVFGVVGRDQ